MASTSTYVHIHLSPDEAQAARRALEDLNAAHREWEPQPGYTLPRLPLMFGQDLLMVTEPSGRNDYLNILENGEEATVHSVRASCHIRRELGLSPPRRAP